MNRYILLVYFTDGMRQKASPQFGTAAFSSLSSKNILRNQKSEFLESSLGVICQRVV